MKAKACKAKGKHSNSSKRGVKIAAQRGAEGMEIVNPHAGGIDCGAQEHYVAVPPQSVESGEPFVRCFSAFTEGLAANEPAPSSRRQRHYRGERFAHSRRDFGGPARCRPTSQTARPSGLQEHPCTDGSRLSRRLSARASLRVGPKPPSLPLLPGSNPRGRR